MSINQSEFWYHNSYNHPPLTDEMLASAEKGLDVKLPALFVELLRLQNGGYTKGFAFPMIEKTSWAEDHIPLSDMFGIVTNHSVDTALNILQTPYLTNEWGLPERQVLLTGEGHWWITLDYRGGTEPTVKWIDVERGDEVHIADSFEDFFNGLVPEDRFAV